VTQQYRWALAYASELLSRLSTIILPFTPALAPFPLYLNSHLAQLLLIYTRISVDWLRCLEREIRIAELTIGFKLGFVNHSICDMQPKDGMDDDDDPPEVYCTSLGSLVSRRSSFPT
jgi:hypothetical protein